MFSNTQINFPKHKYDFQNTNQFQKTGHYIIMNEMAMKSDELGSRVFRVQYGDYMSIVQLCGL